jgi:hypothetical protein
LCDEGELGRDFEEEALFSLNCLEVNTVVAGLSLEVNVVIYD